MCAHMSVCTPIHAPVYLCSSISCATPPTGVGLDAMSGVASVWWGGRQAECGTACAVGSDGGTVCTVGGGEGRDDGRLGGASVCRPCPRCEG